MVERRRMAMKRGQRERDQFFAECARSAGLKELSREIWEKRLEELIERSERLESQPAQEMELVIARARELVNA
jgi:hypothetical protein